MNNNKLEKKHIDLRKQTLPTGVVLVSTQKQVHEEILLPVV